MPLQPLARRSSRGCAAPTFVVYSGVFTVAEHSSRDIQSSINYLCRQVSTPAQCIKGARLDRTYKSTCEVRRLITYFTIH